MKNQQTVYLPVKQDTGLKVIKRPQSPIQSEIHVEKTEAIVLTPEQYKQDMILFADFCDKGFLRGVGKWWKVNKDNEEPTEYTTSELFDIYTTTKEKV